MMNGHVHLDETRDFDDIQLTSRKFVNKWKWRSKGKKNDRHDSFIKRFSTMHHPEFDNDQIYVSDRSSLDENNEITPHSSDIKESQIRKENDIFSRKQFKWLRTASHKLHLSHFKFVMAPDTDYLFYWLSFISISILYNLWIPFARHAFPHLQSQHETLWIILDVISDIVYLLDFLMQFRTGYFEEGLLVYDSKRLAHNYMQKTQFYLDLSSMLPLQLFHRVMGIQPNSLLRFPRLLKVYRLPQLYYLTESKTVFPNVWRVVNLVHILFLIAHWFAGFYAMLSNLEKYNNKCSFLEPIQYYQNGTKKYLSSLYWSMLTLTTIGDLPRPETNKQFLFNILSYLMGVFIFATIVGQIGSVITNRNANRLEYEKLLDAAKQYMRSHKVPKDMQRRVLRWYAYAWSRGRVSGNDATSISLLPDKLKTELALHVNLDTLKKVSIFKECEPQFLHDLILKMRAFIFTPGDIVCRKGETAKEIFIIADGILQVLDKNGKIMAKMHSGDFFGEIAILNIAGLSNKRTADVCSVGYSELFSLTKEDVLSTIIDYPNAERILREYGEKRIKNKDLLHKLEIKTVTINKNEGKNLIKNDKFNFSKGQPLVPNKPVKSKTYTMGNVGTIAKAAMKWKRRMVNTAIIPMEDNRPFVTDVLGCEIEEKTEEKSNDETYDRNEIVKKILELLDEEKKKLIENYEKQINELKNEIKRKEEMLLINQNRQQFVIRRRLSLNENQRTSPKQIRKKCASVGGSETKHPSSSDRIHDSKLSEHDHFEGEEHNAEFDHEAFLGKEEAEEYGSLGTEEVKKRLEIIFGKIDKDHDGEVSKKEMTDWIRYVQQRYVLDDVEKNWPKFNLKLPESRNRNEGYLHWKDYLEHVYKVTDIDEEKDTTVRPVIEREKRRWDFVDQDKDGQLSKEDYTKFIHPEEYAEMKDIVIKETMEDIDLNKDGSVDLMEYLRDMYPDAGKVSEEAEPGWVKAERLQFKQIRDKDHNGVLNEEEVSEWILPSNFDHIDAEVNHLFSSADKDKNDQISKEEMVDHHEIFAGSQATDFGEILNRHDEF
ncbi:hypothetical protein SNEBB_006326 [Seison nebaliae]|nr:hypothetical protein SNEBB_006326 [Seison nebaliae]